MQESTHKVPKSASQAVLSRMQAQSSSTRLTTHGAWRLVHAMSAWSVKTGRVPSRNCRESMVYGRTTTAMHENSTPPPSPHARPPAAASVESKHTAIHSSTPLITKPSSSSVKTSSQSPPALALTTPPVPPPPCKYKCILRNTFIHPPRAMRRNPLPRYVAKALWLLPVVAQLTGIEEGRVDQGHEAPHEQTHRQYGEEPFPVRGEAACRVDPWGGRSVRSVTQARPTTDNSWKNG